MSIKKPQFLFLIFIAASFVVLQYLPVFFSNEKKHKGFAQPFNVSQYSSRGIVDRVIQLKIETRASANHEAPEETEVVAFVSLPFNFSGQLQYKWTLGQNVTLVEGSLTGSSSGEFQQDTSQPFKIIVRGYDKTQLRHIGFEIWGDKNGRRIFADGLISSQKENSFEDVVQHVEKMKAEKLGIRK